VAAFTGVASTEEASAAAVSTGVAAGIGNAFPE